MKVDELRKLNDQELSDELQSLLKEQFNLRMIGGSGQDVRPHMIKNVRKNIAQVKTIMTEKQKQANAKGEGNA